MKLLINILSLFITISAFAQNEVVGDWEGTLKGMQLRLVFHISEKDGQLKTVLDSPDQGAFGLVCDKTAFNDHKLSISLAAAAASFEGMLGEDQTIQGKWIQRGASIELPMKRKTGIEKPIVKPQTPQPPFSYRSDDVEFDNADKSIHYGATITYPDGEGPFPAVVLITGSGLQDRDETLGAHKPFAVIADYLTKNGMAVLRVDDRGMGKTTGDSKNATSEDFSKDVEAAFSYIKTRKEINMKKIGLLGHSEGGMIAPMVASRNKDIAFIVLLAGPGIPIKQLMAEQSSAILHSVGVNDNAINSYTMVYSLLINAILAAPTDEAAKKSALKIFRGWQENTDPEIVKTTTGVFDTASASGFVQRFTDQVSTPWFRYFLGYDPQPTLRKVNCPVLALNGSKDVQVIAKSNLAGIKASLKKNKMNKIEEMPGLNHLFQNCKTCAPTEYLLLDETFSPTALEVIGSWLKGVGK